MRCVVIVRGAVVEWKPLLRDRLLRGVVIVPNKRELGRLLRRVAIVSTTNNTTGCPKRHRRLPRGRLTGHGWGVVVIVRGAAVVECKRLLKGLPLGRKRGLTGHGMRRVCWFRHIVPVKGSTTTGEGGSKKTTAAAERELCCCQECESRMK